MNQNTDMKPKLILTSIILLYFTNFSYSGFPIINYSCTVEQSGNGEITNFSQTTVYICTGKYAYAYHSRPDCPGLNNCKGDIKYTDIYTAANTLERRPCCLCWSNVSRNCINDNPYNQKSSSAQFNPYIPQGSDGTAGGSGGGESYAAAGAVLGTVLVAALIADMNSPKAKARRADKKALYAKKEKLKFEEYYQRKGHKKYKILTGAVQFKKDAPLCDKPYQNATNYYTCPKNAVGTLRGKYKSYYKVSVNGHIGFVTKNFVKVL